MKKELITCPSCGAQMEDSQMFEIECPYCGKKLPYEFTYSVDECVLFSTKEEDAKQKAAWALAQDESVPLDLFDSLSFKATKVYVPLWHLGGSYNASWSCERLEYKDEIYTDRDGKVKTRRSTFPEHIPMNGNAQGAFEILISASKNFPISLDFTKYSSKAYKEELIDKDAYIYDLDIERREAWKSKSVGKCIDEVTGTHISHQLPYAYDNLYYNTSYNRSINRSILFPFWILEYEYKGKKYLCRLRGDNGEIINSSHPKAKVQTLFDKNDISNPISLGTFGWICFFLFVGGGLCALYSGLNKIHGEITMGITMGVTLAITSLVAGFYMSGKQDDEEKSYKRLISNRRKKEKEIRLQHLANVPLLSKYKGQIKKASELDTSSSTHNSLIKKDKNLMSLLYVILFGLLALTLYVIMGNISKKQHEHTQMLLQEQQIQEQTQTELEKITPDLFFNKSKSKIGHLRQDISKRIC